MTRFARRSYKNPEGEIQKSILDFLDTMEKLAKKPIYYFRSGAGAVKTADGWFFKTGRPGCPDITLVVNGKFIGLEVKDVWKKQSEGQKKAEKQIKFAWAEYYVVESLEQVKRILAKEIDIF